MRVAGLQVGRKAMRAMNHAGGEQRIQSGSSIESREEERTQEELSHSRREGAGESSLSPSDQESVSPR